MSVDIKQELSAEALSIVTGARRSAYGAPEQNFQRIRRLWNAHLLNIGVLAPDTGGLEVQDVAALMRLMKEARLAETPDHRDSYVDLVGYSLCGAEVAGVAPKATTALDHAKQAAPPKAKRLFKVGDRVRRTKDAPDCRFGFIGMVGEVVRGDAHGLNVRSDDGRLFKGCDAHAFDLVEEPKPLQIEAGKFYRTRDGQKVGPMRRDETRANANYPWREPASIRAGLRAIWTDRGEFYCFSDKFRAHDLVAEWVD